MAAYWHLKRAWDMHHNLLRSPLRISTQCIIPKAVKRCRDSMDIGLEGSVIVDTGSVGAAIFPSFWAISHQMHGKCPSQ